MPSGGRAGFARAAVLTRSAAPDLGALLPEGGIGERLQRFVQRAQLVCEGEEALGVVEPAVEELELGAQAVEPLEHGVELPVVEGLAVSHGAIVRTGPIPKPSR
jgi:hypothetical protein